ncbi:MAG: protein kinase [Gemmataceae bacterium]|nr:protein kinase [Gemmataceae bacterium]
MSTGCPSKERWKALLDSALPEAQQAELHAHLERCRQCQATLDALSAGRESWVDVALHLADPTFASPALDNVLRDAVEHTQPRDTVADAAGEFDPAACLQPSTIPGHLGRLGHYEILELIGKGGFGFVFKARDQTLDRIVAVKMLSPALASTATARKRFEREAKAAAAIRNDHVISIYAVVGDAAIPYLAMEFIAGQSLQDKLDKKGPLELKEILRIGMQIANGLAAAHAQGQVHRDIKPANILLENGVERVKITDFGLARVGDDASLTQSGTIAGTPMYMSPEQAAGETVDHRADLFSLGSVLYTMCTGRPPFRASGTLGVIKRVMEETPRPIRAVNPEIPEWLEHIIAKLHAKKPEDRFPTAKEVAELLGQHLAHLQQPEQMPRPAPVQSSPHAPRGDAPVAPHGGSSQAPTEAAPHAERGAYTWRIGDRVLAPWEPEWAYPATVREINGDSVYVWFDDGELSWVEAADLRPLDIRDGSRVFGPWGYCGVVTERDGDRVHINYDDGDKEWTDLKEIYVPSGKPPVPKSFWKKAATIVVVALLALAFAEWRGYTRIISYVRSFFDQVVTLDIEDAPVEVKVYETKDLDPNAKGFFVRMRAKDSISFGPAQAFTADANVKSLRLPPGNYWLMAFKDGRMLHRELIRAKLGGESIIRIPGSKKEDATDAAKLQGKWKVQSRQTALEAADASLQPVRIEFSADRMRTQNAEGETISEQLFAIDPTKLPKQIHLFVVGSNAHEGSGIYKFEGDTLTLCVAPTGQPLPTAFKAKGHSDVLTVCNREPARKPVYPARGQAFLEGAPIPGAHIVFTPSKGGVRADAVVAADGSFALTTYNAGDGAVAGDYVITVTLREPNGAGELGPNLLPAMYALPATSPLRWTIAAQKNELLLKLLRK